MFRQVICSVGLVEVLDSLSKMNQKDKALSLVQILMCACSEDASEDHGRKLSGTE